MRLASASGDFVWVDASLNPEGGIDYSVEDERHTEYNFPIKHSERPLSLGEFFQLLDGTVGLSEDTSLLTGPIAWHLKEGENPTDFRNFVFVTSPYYPDLSELCELHIRKWLGNWKRRARNAKRKAASQSSKAIIVANETFPVGSEPRPHQIEIVLTEAMKKEPPPIGETLVGFMAEWADYMGSQGMSGGTSAWHVKFLHWALRGRTGAFLEWTLSNPTPQSERALKGIRKVYDLHWPHASMVGQIFHGMWGWLQLELRKHGERPLPPIGSVSTRVAEWLEPPIPLTGVMLQAMEEYEASLSLSLAIQPTKPSVPFASISGIAVNELDIRINRFLEALKSNGMSSPSGMHWQEFYILIKSKKQKRNDPPPPMILAASGETNDLKHERLADQLQWAVENGCLEEGMQFLANLPKEYWNVCPLEFWGRSGY